LTQGRIADTDFGAALIVDLHAHGLRGGRVALQAGGRRRFAVEDLLRTEKWIVLEFARWNVRGGEGHALGVEQLDLDFVAVQIIAGGDDPAGFQGRRIDGDRRQLKRLIGFEDPILRRTAEAVEKPVRRRSGQQQRQEQHQAGPAPALHTGAPVLSSSQVR
jgi:hypothetical protein